MAFKRKFKTPIKNFATKKRKTMSSNKKRKGPTLSSVSKRLRMMTKTIETKTGVQQWTSDGTEYLHNNLYSISNTVLATVQGLQDAGAVQGNRIGDKITLVGVKFTMMLELNERYSDVSFRLMVIRSAKGDTPTTTTLWQGASGNKMLDTFNTERFSLLHTQIVKIRAPNQGIDPALIQQTGSGIAVGTDVISRATRIVKIWVPGKRFSRNGRIL